MSSSRKSAKDKASPVPVTDWAALRAMTDAQKEAGAKNDPDAPPLTEGRTMRRMAATKRLRIKLALSQAEFAKCYRIPLASIEQWERYTAEPDEMARAYIAAISADPEGVAAAVAAPASPIAAE